MDRTEELKQHAINLFKQTVTQLEDLSRVLIKPATLDRLKADAKGLVEERERLFKKFGEECFRLIESNSLPVPKPVKKLYTTIRSVMDDLMNSLHGDGSTTDGIDAIDDAPVTKKTRAKPSAAKKPKSSRTKKPRTATSKK
jgi:hypothetical protein